MNIKLDEYKKYSNLFTELVRKGIKLKYRRSYLGIIWSMIEPLLTMIVLTIVFGTLLGHNEKEFPVYILAGRLIYTLFSQSSTAALKSIRANQGMIKKVYVPKALYPLSAITFNYTLFLISLVVLLGVSLVLGVYPTWRILLAIVPLLILFLLSVGAGLILSTVGVFFRDMEYLWNVLLMLVMYTCAIFYYPEKILGSGVGWILKYNPLFCIISNFRSCVFGTSMDAWMLGYSAVFAIVSVLFGIIIFDKNQDKFILYI
ncbi:MAG: ABC transporter permease [Lachnospiraceae bacterium]|nr:ABC transporter permease [Lachnospiraceae bacterium]